MKGWGTHTSSQLKASFLWRVRILLLISFVNLPLAHAETASPLALTQEEHAWIAQHPVIRVGFSPGWAPIEFRDSLGRPAGIAVKYTNFIQEKLGLRFEFPDTESWEQLVAMAQANEVDLLPAITPTQQLQESLNFTNAYLPLSVVILARSEAPLVVNIENLYGQRIGVMDTYAAHKWIAKDYPHLSLKTYRNVDEMLRELATGKIDACIESILVANYGIQQGGYSNLQVAGDTPYTLHLSMATRPDWPILQGILNKALNSISAAEHNAIQSEWLTVAPDQTLNWQKAWRWFSIIGGTLLGALILILLWNRQLHKVARTRTSELALANKSLRHSELQLQRAQEVASIGS